MGLGSALNIALSGLHSVEFGLDTVSKNTSNASTAGYVTEIPNLMALTVNGSNMGVRIGHTTLALSPPLMSALYGQNGKVGMYNTLYQSLNNISALQGTTGADSDGNSNVMGSLSNYLGDLKTSLVRITSAPTDGSTQYDAVSNAQTMVNNIHVLTSAYQSQRQNAHDAIVASMPQINTDLTTIGVISKKIMVMQASGEDTSDLENQRLGLMNDLSNQVGVSFTEKPNGDMTVTTEDGMLLPTRPDQIGQKNDNRFLPSSDWPLSVQKATIAPNMYYSSGEKNGGIPGIMLNGKDVTQHLTNGALGANITLRDQTYPRMQAQMDSFAATLINRFDAAGLPLFSPLSRAGIDPASQAAIDPVTHNVKQGPAINGNADSNVVLDTNGNPLRVNGGYYLKADSTGKSFIAVKDPAEDVSGKTGTITFDEDGGITGAAIDGNVKLGEAVNGNSDSQVVLDSDGKPLKVNGGYYLKPDSTGKSFVAVQDPTEDVSGKTGTVSFDSVGRIKGARIDIDMTDLASRLSVNQDYIDDPSLITTRNGKTGDLSIVNNVLNKTFSSGIENVSGALEAPTAGLGPDGSFTTGYPGNEALDQLATDMIATQGRVISNAKSSLTSETSIQTNITTMVNSVSGVNVNNQMSMIVTLQNSYAANAKVVSAVRAMFDSLMNAV